MKSRSNGVDTQPLAENEHYVLADVGDSRTDLNIISEPVRTQNNKPSLFRPFNGRLVLLLISILCFILSLFLFVGTVVVFSNHSTDKCPLQAFNQDRSVPVEDPFVPNEVPGRVKCVTQDSTSNPSTNNDASATAAAGGDTGGQLENKWSVTKVNGKHVRPGVLVYNEEFNTFNTSKWRHIVEDSDSNFFYWVNYRNNSYVKNGTLYLKPTFTADTHGHDYVNNGTLLLGMIPAPKCVNTSVLCWKREGGIVHPIMSAMVTSKPSFRFTYGRLVIRAKMPGGDWIEPIVSLQPDRSIYGEGLLSGQVHLVDTRGNTKLFDGDLNVGSERTCPDIRYGTAKEPKVIHGCLNTDPDEGWDKDFHDYELLWTPESMTVKIDGEGIMKGPDPVSSFFKYWTRGRRMKNPWKDAENNVMAPFDVDFNVVMGLNIGGNTGFFHDDFESPYPKPWSNSDINAPKAFWEARDKWAPSWENERSALQIDYIRLYSLDETTSD